MHTNKLRLQLVVTMLAFAVLATVAGSAKASMVTTN